MSDNKEKSTPIKKPILVKKLNPTAQNTSQTTASSDTKKPIPVASVSVKATPTSPTNKAASTTLKVTNPANTNSNNKVANTTPKVTNPTSPTNPANPASKEVAAPKAISIAPATINRPIADGSLTKSSLDLTIKIYELPKDVNINAQGSKEFFVTANDRQVFISVKAKQFNKLIEAQEKWTSWIARISGNFGSSTKDGFILDNPNIQVFEFSKDKNTSSPTATKDKPPIRSTQPRTKVGKQALKQIKKLFNPYLTKGIFPPQDQIDKVRSTYRLSEDLINETLNKLIRGARLEKQVAFLIEKTYFKLLETFKGNYLELLYTISRRLNLEHLSVATWLRFIHTPANYLDNYQMPSEETKQQVISFYKQYLLQDTSTQPNLHVWIADSIDKELKPEQVFKVLSNYRSTLQQSKFPSKFYYKSKQDKEIVTQSHSESDDTSSNGNSDNTEL